MWRTIGQSAAAGVIATLSMDVLSAAAYKLRVTAPLPPNLVGRWFAAVARAHPFHADIATAPSVPHEIALALPVHYAIGMTLTAFYVWTAFRLGLPARHFGLALSFGLATNVLPWLLMFPAMGYGWFGAHGPVGTRLFASSLFSHACFGLGIWIAMRVIATS